MTVPKPRRVVGILGGMGPEATILLQQRILRATAANDDHDHVPLLVDVNTQVPSRIEALVEGTGESAGPVLVAMAQRLEAMGADALAMPCNTAHAYAREIEAAVTIPFLDMVQLAVSDLRTRLPRGASVGLLGSTALASIRLYDDAIAAVDLELLWPREQERVMAALRAIKRRADDPEAAVILARAGESLIDAGAAALLVACTEFSLVVDALPDGVPVVDALDGLVGAILAFAGR